MARIYVASSWRNPHQQDLVAILRLEGHQVYDFRNPPNGPSGFGWAEIDPAWESWSPERYIDVLHNHPRAAQGFLSDLRGMQWADTCVLVMPCGRSAHLEAGWMAGAGKRTIVLLAGAAEPELMYLLAHDIVTSPIDLVAKLRGAGRPSIRVGWGSDGPKPKAEKEPAS